MLLLLTAERPRAADFLLGDSWEAQSSALAGWLEGSASVSSTSGREALVTFLKKSQESQLERHMVSGPENRNKGMELETEPKAETHEIFSLELFQSTCRLFCNCAQ